MHIWFFRGQPASRKRAASPSNWSVTPVPKDNSSTATATWTIQMQCRPIRSTSTGLATESTERRRIMGYSSLCSIPCLIVGRSRSSFKRTAGMKSLGEPSEIYIMLQTPDDRSEALGFGSGPAPPDSNWKFNVTGNCSGQFVLKIGRLRPEFDVLHVSNHSNRYRFDMEARAVPTRQIKRHEGPVAKCMAHLWEREMNDLNMSILGRITANLEVMSPIRSQVTLGASSFATFP